MVTRSVSEISRTALIGHAAPMTGVAAGGLNSNVAKGSGTPIKHGRRLDQVIALGLRDIIKYGASNIFTNRYEFNLLRSNPKLHRDVAARAKEIIAQGHFDAANFSPLEIVLVPKTLHGTWRLAAVMEPLDAVSYLGLVLIAATGIEQKKIPIQDEVVFSYRVKPNRSGIFDNRYHAETFVDEIEIRSITARYRVSCDIADYYMQISIDSVRKRLAECGQAPWLIEYITGLLEFWSGGTGRGLPVGLTASHILAEAVLSRIDHALSHENVEFIRLVDNYQIFAHDEASAIRALTALRDLVACEQLQLNPLKTHVHDLSRQPTEALAGDRLVGIEHKAFFESNAKLHKDGTRRRSGKDLLERTTLFRQPAAGDIAEYRMCKNPPDAMSFLRGDAAPVWRLKYALNIALYGKNQAFLMAIPDTVDRYPEFCRYAVSALLKKSSMLSNDLRQELSSGMADRLFKPQTPLFVVWNILELLSDPDYSQRAALERYAETWSVEPRGALFRALLDALRSSGGIPEILRSHMTKTDAQGRRAFVFDAVSRGDFAELPQQFATDDVFVASLLK